MSKYKVFNIVDMADAIGETNLKQFLSDFYCPRNKEIQHFVRNNAYEFARKKLSVTYLVMNEDNCIVAVFTLAYKAVEIGNTGLSNSKRKKMNRYANLDLESDSHTVSAFLIAQFGKNFALDAEKRLNGNVLMDFQHEIGGGVVFLECEDSPKLLDFYQSEKNGFIPFNERYSISDNTKYVQLFNFF